MALSLDLAAKRKRRRSDYFFWLDYRMRWADNDIFTHANNPIYGVLADSVINAFLITQCNYQPPNNLSGIAIIANTYFDYFGSVSYPGVVDVGLRVVKLGGTSVVYEVGIFDRREPGQEGAEGEEDVVKAVGGSTHIWCERLEGGGIGRPLKAGMEREVRRGYEALMGREKWEAWCEERKGKSKL